MGQVLSHVQSSTNASILLLLVSLNHSHRQGYRYTSRNFKGFGLIWDKPLEKTH